MILKCCIIDDEPLAIELLESYVKKTPFLQLEASFTSAVQAIERISKGDIDLIFLDIQMPELDGMEFSRMIEGKSRVIFTTAFGQYAVDSYKVNAVDYLLKPFEDKDLELIISRFMERIELERKAAFFPAALANTSQTFMVFTPTNDMRALRPAEIGYFRYCSERKQWEAVLSGQTPLPLKKSTTADQIVRYAPCFVQIHQSFIINIDYLMIIKDGKCVLYPPFENVDELLVSKKYKKELQDRYCL
mgnify:CR=1 FL=1